MSTSSMFRGFSLWLLAAMIALSCDSVAAELAASASLRQRAANVGESVSLEIKVTGARRLPAAPDIQVDGLDVRYIGPSQNSIVRSFNGSFQSESSVTFNYEVIPRRAGSFTIPAMEIEADGKRLQTQPVGFTADPGNARSRGGREEVGKAEIVVPKTTAYVGEALPIELRLMVDARIRWGSNSKPELEAEGFTVHDIPAPRQEQQQQDGRQYDVLVYRTAVTPSKAGKLTIGPAAIAFVAQVPRAQPRRQRGLFDLDDIFGDPMFAVNQNFKARTHPVEIEVKPLPTTGRPQNFSGAVGQFKVAAEGSPQQVDIGDPVTMQITISGRGNFDRIGAPALHEPSGWRAYPPSQEFKADDEVGISGAKTFSVAVIPQVKKTEMPRFDFSYFDPVAAKYVTLQTAASPLVVTGAPPPQPATRAPAPSDASPEAAGEATKPPAAPNDILGLRYDRGVVRESFEPMYTRRAFWLAQLIPLGVLLVLLAMRIFRVDPAVQRKQHWKQERASLQARLRNAEAGSPEFLEDAARLIQLEAATSSDRNPASIDAAAALRARRVDDETAREIEAIFDARGELLYAGGGGEGAAAGITRERVLAVLERYRQADANS